MKTQIPLVYVSVTEQTLSTCVAEVLYVDLTQPL